MLMMTILLWLTAANFTGEVFIDKELVSHVTTDCFKYVKNYHVFFSGPNLYDDDDADNGDTPGMSDVGGVHLKPKTAQQVLLIFYR